MSVKFSGISPLDVDQSCIDVNLLGVGRRDLRNEFDLVRSDIVLTPEASILRLSLVGLSRKGETVQLEFRGVRFRELSYHDPATVAPNDKTLFDGLQYWDNQNGAGFAIETGLAYYLLEAEEIAASMTIG